MAEVEIPRTTLVSGGGLGHAYYSATLSSFVATSDNAVLGELTRASGGALLDTQRDAWLAEIDLLRKSLRDLDGMLFLEFDVPRIGSRIDAVMVSRTVVIVIEFKVGEKTFKGADINQVWDYALDLTNFYQASHATPIVPILVATEATSKTPTLGSADPDQVFRPVLVGAKGLDAALHLAIAAVDGPPIDTVEWAASSYRPTPTIVEAARALYAHHSVDAIARNDAETQNLGRTSKRVEGVIEEARRKGTKAIVFVTGVPGAGKTLVGLDIATRKSGDTPTHAVYLSGNGPLVKVLSEALTVDEVR